MEFNTELNTGMSIHQLKIWIQSQTDQMLVDGIQWLMNEVERLQGADDELETLEKEQETLQDDKLRLEEKVEELEKEIKSKLAIPKEAAGEKPWSNMPERRMQSKYNSTCKKCGKYINEGDFILWSKSAGARHEVCP